MILETIGMIHNNIIKDKWDPQFEIKDPLAKTSTKIMQE